MLNRLLYTLPMLVFMSAIHAQPFRSLTYFGFFSHNGPVGIDTPINPAVVFNSAEINSFILSYNNTENIDWYGQRGVKIVAANLFDAVFDVASCTTDSSFVRAWIRAHTDQLVYIRSFYVDEPYLRYVNHICNFSQVNNALAEFISVVKDEWAILRPADETIAVGISEPFAGYLKFTAPSTPLIDWIGLQCYPWPLSSVPDAESCRTNFLAWKSNINVTTKEFVLIPPVFDYTSNQSTQTRLVSEIVQLNWLRQATALIAQFPEITGLMPFSIGHAGVYESSGECIFPGDWPETSALWGCTTLKKYSTARDYILSEFRLRRLWNQSLIQAAMTYD